MGNFFKLITSVFVFCVLLISCKDDSITKSANEEIPIDRIGYYHNQALNMLYNDERINVKNMSYSEVRKNIRAKLADKYSQKFDNGAFGFRQSVIDEGLISSGFLKFKEAHKRSAALSGADPIFTGDLKKIIQYLKDKEQISNDLSSRLLKLFDKKAVWDSKVDPIAYAKKILSPKNLNRRNKKYAKVFISVLQSSNEFWEDRLNSKQAKGV